MDKPGPAIGRDDASASREPDGTRVPNAAVESGRPDRYGVDDEPGPETAETLRAGR